MSESSPNPPTSPRFGREAPRSPSEALEPTEVKPPVRRSRQSRSDIVVFLNGVLWVLTLLALASLVAAYVARSSFFAPGPLEQARTVVVKDGAGLNTIASQLESAGVIDSQLAFRVAARAKGATRDLKAGEYAFSPRMSMAEVLDTLRSGRGLVHRVTIPEGLTVFQIFDRLRRDEVLEGELPAQMPPEGTLMPDTYSYQRGTTRADLVRQMAAAHERFVEEVWLRRVDNLPIDTKEEMVTLASIVEKETGQADERQHVASVFVNRLRKGMRLQSDPTILYGLFGGEGRPPNRPIYRSDIQKPTPYNTYTIDGLPPGPIANPGRAALEAVANPSVTDDLYFVADGTGGHVFAATLKEHNANVARWRAIEKRLKSGQASEATEGGEGGETLGGGPGSLEQPAQ